MILGVGNDIVDIRRIERILDRYGTRFTARVFTPVERQKSDGRYARAASYAKRYAAKEACSKALGTGFSNGIFWRDLGVVNEATGKPTLVLTGNARARLEAITPAGHSAVIHLTITDEFPYAQAMVIIWAVQR
jgi:holo-[acyl-carrier protein] synthase